MVVVHLFLNLLDFAFYGWIAIACVALPLLALRAIGRRIDRGLNPPPPRDLVRAREEWLKHERHMGRL
jgi:hypothetical protein